MQLYFEKHCWAAGLYGAQSSASRLCENCVLSKCHLSQIEKQIDVMQLLVVHLVTYSIPYLVFFYLTLLEEVGTNVDSRYHLQLELEIQDKNQILKKKFLNLSRFD